MLACCIISMLANPILYLGGLEIYYGSSPSFIYTLTFIISYSLAGCITWRIRQSINKWWKLAIITYTLTSIILLLLTIIWINTYIKDAMTGLVFLSSNFFATLFSAIALGAVSYIIFRDK